MMFLIDHYIAESKIHGLGTFAAERAAKGTLIWQFDPVIDREIPEETLASLPAHVVKRIHRHAEYLPDKQLFVLGADGAMFTNHSESPNLSSEGYIGHALRDIEIGDEITVDYRLTIVHDFVPTTLSDVRDCISENF